MIPLLVFQEHKTKKMICSGHENDGLYYLDHDGSFSFTSSTLSATMSQFQWHFPLGHPYLAKLKSTIPTSSHLSLAQQ